MTMENSKSKTHQHLKIMLFVMGFLIVLFNVQGYDVLFSAKPLIPFIPISPFGYLLGFAEFAVLLWTSAVIEEWHTSSRILKISMFVLVLAFWFLCYAGINSYLDSLANVEISKVVEARQLKSNNEEYLASINENIIKFEQQLTHIRAEQISINEQISAKNSEIKELNDKASDRRSKTRDCSAVLDCAASVKAFDDQASNISLEVEHLNEIRKVKQNQLSNLQAKLETAQVKIEEEKMQTVQNMNQFAGTESSFELKKAGYEKAIVSLLALANIKVEKPFDLFMMLISGLIYPVYFLLNLFLSLNSQANIDYRERQKQLRLDKKQQRQSLKDQLSLKLIKYFRVWAHRRQKTKTIEIELEKIVEVPTEIFVDKIVEVEKVIEKEIEVEKIVEVEKLIHKEVIVEVERIVEVPTEVPVYVDKIKKVPEPVFINDPQIIIHERIIPVPADITAKELEEIINAQPRLNTSIREKTSQGGGDDASQPDFRITNIER